MNTLNTLIFILYFFVWLLGIILQNILMKRLKKLSDLEIEKHLGKNAKEKLLYPSIERSITLIKFIFSTNTLINKPDFFLICIMLRICVALILGGMIYGIFAI